MSCTRFPECQGTPCSKQARYLKIKWLQRDSNPQPFSSQMNTQPFGQTDQMTECVLSTYLYDAFDCMLLSCHVRNIYLFKAAIYTLKKDVKSAQS